MPNVIAVEMAMKKIIQDLSIRRIFSPYLFIYFNKLFNLKENSNSWNNAALRV